jgi:hypothetical protein
MFQSWENLNRSSNQEIRTGRNPADKGLSQSSSTEAEPKLNRGSAEAQSVRGGAVLLIGRVDCSWIRLCCADMGEPIPSEVDVLGWMNPV